MIDTYCLNMIIVIIRIIPPIILSHGHHRPSDPAKGSPVMKSINPATSVNFILWNPFANQVVQGEKLKMIFRF